MTRKELAKQYKELAARYGWKLEWTRRGHPAFEREGYRTVYGSGTPSDYRSIRNIEAKLRHPFRNDGERS